MTHPLTDLPANLTALQLHVAFRDYNNDSILFSLGGLLILLFFSFPTTLGHSWLPDPFFRIYTDSIYKVKHGSDSGIYDSDGHLREPLLLVEMDSSSRDLERECGNGTNKRDGSLGVGDLFRLHARNCVAADPAGWSFAAMERWITWLLLQRDRRLWKDDLRAVYDGTLFRKIREKRMEKEGWTQGYGYNDWAGTLWHSGTWKMWEVNNTQIGQASSEL